jgi:hypothetical protein
MVVVELTGFAPLAHLDSGGTGEALLVGILRDVTGAFVICSDDNARAPDANNPPVHTPIDVRYDQSIGLRCNSAGRLQPNGQVELTFVAFEIDDFGIIAEVVDIALDAVSVLGLIEPTPAGEAALTLTGLINNGLESSGAYTRVDLMGVYFKSVGQQEDYSQQGVQTEDGSFRLYYHTSPVLNQHDADAAAPKVVMKPESELRELLKTLMPHRYFVCQRKEGQQSCRNNGALNLRAAPCALTTKRQEQGGNVIGVAGNGTYVERIREEFVPSECPSDGVKLWMYVRTEDGQEGYMSASLKYLNPDFLHE